MICFWNGILQGLMKPELSVIEKNAKNAKNAKQLVIELKEKNKMTKSVKCNGEAISEKITRGDF